MIRVYADSSRDRALIVEAIGTAAHVVNGAGHLAQADTYVECVILGTRHPISAEKVALVRELRRNMPWIPLIVVTDDVPAVALWLTETGVSEIVRFEDIRTELQSQIVAVCRVATLHSWAQELQRSTLTPALRAALAHGLRSATDHPVRTVEELAAVIGRAPVTLSQTFRASVAGEFTLGRFLSALVILRAHQLRHSGLGWDVVGHRLGFTRRTLHRKSRTWPGLTLQQLARTSRSQLNAAFVSDYMQPLLQPTASNLTPRGMELLDGRS